MKIPFVDLHAQYHSIKGSIDSAIQEVIENTAFIGGKYVKDFEKAFAEFYGVNHFIGVANGTDAIYVALRMMGIGSGDEVITVANSWFSTSETIGQTGATPVFVDIETDGFNIDVNLIEEKITPKTKGIIPVHLHGHPADLDPIVALCEKYNLKLIEDCAQAHLAEYNGKRVGLIGDIATFSFYPGKNLGAYGDAGGIITNDDELAKKCRMFANHGALVKHQHQIEGINSRLDGLQAAILNAKLEHLPSWTENRRRVAATYRTLLTDVPQVILPKERSYAKAVYHLFVLRCEKRDDLMQFLKNNGIGVVIHYPTPLPLLDAYQHLNYYESSVPLAHKYSKEILSIPIYPEMTEEMCVHVVEKIKEFYKN